MKENRLQESNSNERITGSNYKTDTENQDKLTDWKNEPTVNDLRTDYEKAKEVQANQISKIREWNDLINVKGKAKPPKKDGRSAYQPKLIRKQNEWRYSALTEPFHSSADLIKVEPVTFEDHEAARQNTLLINWQFRTKIDRVKFIDDVVRSTVDEGTCIVKVGWKFFTDKVKKEFPVFEYYAIENEEDLQILQEAIAYKQENPTGFENELPEELKEAVNYYEENDTPVVAVITGMEEREVDEIVENYPTVEVMDLENVYIDPSCRSNLDDALFIINSYEINQAELNKNKDLYKNLDQIIWEGDSDGDSEFNDNETFRNFNDPIRRKKIAYDYWGFYDIDGTGILKPILATWIDNVMIRMVDNPFPDGKPPFVIMNYMPIKRRIYGEPDAELLKDNQQLAGAYGRSAIDILARTANAQTAIFKGVLDGVNRNRLENEENFEINPNQHPNGGIIPIVSPEIPSSILNMIEMNNHEAESLTGVKSFSGGLSGDAYGKVATNTRGVLDAASKREMAILRRIAGGVKAVAMKIISMNGAFLTKEETIRVTNAEFISIDREDIKGNFDLIVDISTAEIDEAKANDMIMLMQTIGNTVDQGITQVVLSEILELKRLPKVAQMVRTFQPQPSPEEQEMMELELELKRTQVEDAKAEVELKRAKAMEAMAKANSTEVDTVRTADGTAHMEGIEKSQAQAEANRRLEADKARYNTASKLQDAIINKASEKPEPRKAPIQVPSSPEDISQYRNENPILNIHSSKFDPSQDRSLNLANNRM